VLQFCVRGLYALLPWLRVDALVFSSQRVCERWIYQLWALLGADWTLIWPKA
jgi:hypothetical protein